MNKAWFWLVIVAASLCFPVAWAATPQDLSHTAVVKNTDGSLLHIIKIYLRDGNKLRVEYLSPEGAVNAVAIYRKDKGLAWGVEPDTRTYTQGTIDPGDWDRALFSVFPEPGLTFKKTGEEPCSSFVCDIVTSDLSTFSLVEAHIRDMNVIMKSDMVQNGKVVQSSKTTKFKLEKPPAALFELPAKYKRRAIVR